MLVSQVSEIVDTLDIVPDPLLWKILDWLEWLSNEAWLRLGRLLSAWSIWVDELSQLLGCLSRGKKGEDCKLCLRFKAASESDQEFMQTFRDNPKKLGLFIDETYLPLRPPASKLMHAQRKHDAHGTKLYRVKPFPDPTREETKWMTEAQIQAEALKPSTHWVEAGSGAHGKGLCR